MKNSRVFENINVNLIPRLISLHNEDGKYFESIKEKINQLNIECYKPAIKELEQDDTYSVSDDINNFFDDNAKQLEDKTIIIHPDGRNQNILEKLQVPNMVKGDYLYEGSPFQEV